MIVISVLHLFESRNIDIGDGIGYDMDRFPTIRERTVYRIVPPISCIYQIYFERGNFHG